MHSKSLLALKKSALKQGELLRPQDSEAFLLALFYALFEYQSDRSSVLALRESSDQLKILLKRLKLPTKLSATFNNFTEELYSKLLSDAQAILDGDPAAKSLQEVISAYPGFFAIFCHRVAHIFYQDSATLLARLISEYAHQVTGIDIHPGALISESFCIDHGTGIVIGETAIIGKGVKIYQGVTLGGLSVSKKMAGNKRHPTLEDKVVVYAGATILGGTTIVGESSIIGANVWLTTSVPAASKVFHQPKVEVRSSKSRSTKDEK